MVRTPKPTHDSPTSQSPVAGGEVSSLGCGQTVDTFRTLVATGVSQVNAFAQVAECYGRAAVVAGLKDILADVSTYVVAMEILNMAGAWDADAANVAFGSWARGRTVEEVRDLRGAGFDIIDDNVYVEDCPWLRDLPDGFSVEVDLWVSKVPNLTTIGEGLCVGVNAELECLDRLTSIGGKIDVGGSLNLTGCTALASLGDGIIVHDTLNLTGCAALAHLPAEVNVEGDLWVGGCGLLADLPADLCVCGCLQLDETCPLSNLTDEAIRAMAPGVQAISREEYHD